MSKTPKIYEKMGRKIQKARQEKGITQEKLAEMADISRTHMGHIEQGRRQPTLDVVQKIAKALRMKANELIPF